jgi:sarcosine oxidase, subunit beta
MAQRVVVIGAGIAGVAVAHQLVVEHGLSDVMMVDPRAPLTLTSDKSTECYRNWWPNPSMVGLMNRSIDLLEAHADGSDNAFGLNRRGYLFVTQDPETLARWGEQAHETSMAGGGPVRTHPGPIDYRPSPPDGFHHQPEGVDILEGTETIREFFPFITPSAIGALHVRRAGWFSAQQLGSLMLEQATGRGLTHLRDHVVAVTTSNSAITGVELAGGDSISCDAVVNAAGPMAGDIAALVGLELPLSSEVHLKVAFRDHRQLIPRDAPMVIWADTQTIDWTDEERAALREAGRDDLLDTMPVYCHGRPEGGTGSPYSLALWEYHNDIRKPEWPLPADDMYPEVVMRGLTTMIPALQSYLQGLPQSAVDGGYYTKTPENRPLIGPAGPEGFHLACGYSGFGVMVACGAADLAARHVTGSPLPDYAPDFLLSRYADQEYLRAVGAGAETGQL